MTLTCHACGLSWYSKTGTHQCTCGTYVTSNALPPILPTPDWVLSDDDETDEVPPPDPEEERYTVGRYVGGYYSVIRKSMGDHRWVHHAARAADGMAIAFYDADPAFSPE